MPKTKTPAAEEAPVLPPQAPAVSAGRKSVAFTLSNRAMLIYYTRNGWSGAKYDKEAGAGVAQAHGSNEAWGHYEKLLVSKQALQKVRQATQAAYEDHLARTLAWKQEGCRLILNTAIDAYEKSQLEHRDNVRRAQEDLERNWLEYVAESRRELNGLWKEADYPSARQVSARFHVGYRIEPLADASNWLVDLDAEVLERLKKNAEADAQEAARNAVSQKLTWLVQTVGHMADTLAQYQNVEWTDDQGKRRSFKGRRFENSLVENVREVAAILPTVNLLDDPRIADLAQRIERDLCGVDAPDLKTDDRARAQVAARAAQITAEAKAIAKTMDDFV